MNQRAFIMTPETRGIDLTADIYYIIGTIEKLRIVGC